MENMVLFIRAIEVNDVDSVTCLLGSLSNTIDTDPFKFANFVRTLPSNQHILVLEEDNVVFGIGTLFLEKKIIHHFGVVGHIEDVVILPSHQGKGYGKILVQHLVQLAKQEKCYKCILNCDKENVAFYTKCGFHSKSEQMAIYF